MKVAISRISLTSLGKHGCLLGSVAALVPSLICSLAGLGAAGLLRRWLQGWQDLTISLLGQEVARIDLVGFVGLEGLLSELHVLAGVSTPLLFLSVLALTLVCGLLLALIAALVGLAYNTLALVTGGVVVEMKASEPGLEQREGPSE
ncbi:hypothetical protein ACFLT5_01120 [Chloroflexota bacterium]